MRSIPGLASFCLLSLVAAACASAPPKPRYPAGSLGSRVEEIVLRTPHGVNLGIAYQHLATGVTYFHDETTAFHAASTMKVPVMMALFSAVENGQLRLDQPIAVRNQFQSIVDGSVFSLDPKEDGDPDLYQALGGTRTLEELLRRMITRSSNLATNLLIEKVGAPTVNDLMRRLGALDIHVLRGVEDDKAFRAGLNNRVTAKDLAIALRALLPDAPDPLFSAASRQKMIEILEAQEFNEKIPAGLPNGTPVAHKTGDITGIHHDAAIVFPAARSPYILVVLTSGIADDKEANRLIAEISRVVWESREKVPSASSSPHPEPPGEGPGGDGPGHGLVDYSRMEE
jgi:beta-lactamase class A